MAMRTCVLYHLSAGDLDEHAEAGGGGKADPSPCLSAGNVDKQAELEEGLAVAKGTCHLISVRRPDITVMVDWALKINYISIYLSQCEEFGHILEKVEIKMKLNEPGRQNLGMY